MAHAVGGLIKFLRMKTFSKFIIYACGLTELAACSSEKEENALIMLKIME